MDFFSPQQPREFGMMPMATQFLRIHLRFLGFIHLVLSLLPVSLHQVRIGILHILVVQPIWKMKEKKEMFDRIQRDMEDRKRRQEQYEKLKASVEARRQAEAKAKANVSPKTEAKPSGPVPKAKSMPPAGGPQVKAMPKRANAFHNLSYAVEHSSVEIESVSTDEETQQVAIPTPKAQQQYKTYEAAMKRMRRQ